MMYVRGRSNRAKGLVLLAVMVAIAATPSSRVFSHGGQIEVNEGGPRGPVKLSDAQAKLLGLQTVQADLRPIARLLRTNGELAALPDKQAEVSLRINGNVEAVFANIGDMVRAGQKLALVQSRIVGNPPPIVEVIAPIAGVVDKRNVINGQNVEPNIALFHVSDLSRMRMVTRIYEEDLGKVRLGQKAYVKLLAYPGELLQGVVSLIGPTLDQDSRTVEVWVLLDNDRGLLKPNLFGQADIVLSQNNEALSVPNDAILEANEEKFVFVRNGDEFDRVDVDVGAADDQFTEVKSGLVPGDEVVTLGARELYTLWLTGGKIQAEE